MYKLTRINGTDFYSGTINYADNIGKIVRVNSFDPPESGDCGKGLHSCKNPNDCFIGARIPCRAFQVKTIDVICRGTKITRSQGLKVIGEIKDLDSLFGWKYSEAINPINPFKINAPQVTDEHIELLKKWDSVWDSVWASVWDSVWDSVRDSVGASVGDSVWASVRDSVWASVWAYIGSLFPLIKKWKYIKHEINVYPFQPAVDLWKQGFVPSRYDGNVWRLHAGGNATIVWEGKL